MFLKKKGSHARARSADGCIACHGIRGQRSTQTLSLKACGSAVLGSYTFASKSACVDLGGRRSLCAPWGPVGISESSSQGVARMRQFGPTWRSLDHDRPRDQRPLHLAPQPSQHRSETWRRTTCARTPALQKLARTPGGAAHAADGVTDEACAPLGRPFAIHMGPQGQLPRACGRARRTGAAQEPHRRGARAWGRRREARVQHLLSSAAR